MVARSKAARSKAAAKAPAAARSFDLPEAYRYMRNGRLLPPPVRRLHSCQPDPAPPKEAQDSDQSDLLETRYIERNMLHVVSRYCHHLKQFGLSTPAALKFS